MQPKNKQKRSSKVAKNRLVLDHRNCSLCDLCIMVLIVELMTIWRTQEQKVGVFQDYFVFPFPKIRIFEISSNPYYLCLCSCSKRFYYRRPRDSNYTMKTKLEPVHSTISWYTWAKNMFQDFLTVFNLAYCCHKSHFLAETDCRNPFQDSPPC